MLHLPESIRIASNSLLDWNEAYAWVSYNHR
jgi:hypothetical protein